MVLGGDAWEFISDDAYLYEVSTGTYSNLPELPQRRTGAAVVAICRDATCLYFIGGAHDFNETASRYVDMFDMAKGEWIERIAQLVDACLYHAAVVHNGIIIITGGIHAVWDTPSSSTCQCLDVSTHAVTSIPKMINERAHHACVVYRDEVVVIGGTQYRPVQMSDLPMFVQDGIPIAECERLSADMQTWTPFAELPAPLSEDITAAVACDKIFAMSRHYPSGVVVFDGTAWCTLATLPRHAGPIVYLDGEIIVLPTTGGMMPKLDPVLLVWSEGPYLPLIPEHSAVVSF